MPFLVWLNPGLLCLFREVISLWDVECCEAKITGSYLDLLSQVWELLAQGKRERGSQRSGPHEHPGNLGCRWIFLSLNWAPCILITSIIFLADNYFCQQARSQITVVAYYCRACFLKWNQIGKGICVIQAEGEREREVEREPSLALPPVGNSDTNPAWCCVRNQQDTNTGTSANCVS